MIGDVFRAISTYHADPQALLRLQVMMEMLMIMVMVNGG